MAIKSTITDVDALERIQIDALRAYLNSHGWALRENWRDRVLVWTLDAETEVSESGMLAAQILTPCHRHTGSYATRVSEAISQLAETEGRSQLDVYDDLLALTEGTHGEQKQDPAAVSQERQAR